MMYGQTLLPPEEAASIRLYKVTGPAGEPLHGGSGPWPLPSADRPGEWRDVDGPIEACRSGLHLTDATHLFDWVPNSGDPIVWRAETRGPVYRVDESKYVVGSARLLPRKSRKGPSLETIRARRIVAERRAARRIARADAVLARDAGPGWARYARVSGVFGGMALPPNIPARMLGIIRAWLEDRGAAERALLDARAKCAAAERAALLPAED